MTYMDVFIAMVVTFGPLLFLWIVVSIVGVALIFFISSFLRKDKTKSSMVMSSIVLFSIFGIIVSHYFVPDNLSGNEQTYPIRAYYSPYSAAMGSAWSPDGKKLAISYNGGNKISIVNYNPETYGPFRGILENIIRMFDGHVVTNVNDPGNNLSFIDAGHIAVLPPVNHPLGEYMPLVSIVDVEKQEIHYRNEMVPSKDLNKSRLYASLMATSKDNNIIALVKGNNIRGERALEIRNSGDWHIISRTNLNSSAVGVDVSNSGAYVAVSSYGNYVGIYDTAGKELKQIKLCPDGSGSGVAKFSPDEKYIVVSLRGGNDTQLDPHKPSVCVVDWQNQTVVKQYAMGTPRVESVMFSYDGKYLSYLDNNKFLHIEKFQTTEKGQVFTAPADSTAWSPVSNDIAVTSNHMHVTVYGLH